MTQNPVSEVLSNANILAFFDYWRGQRSGHEIPVKSNINPRDIRAFLKNVYVAEFEAPDVFRYRLAGSEIAQVFGRKNLKGLTLHDILSQERLELVLKRWMPLIEERAVLCMKGRVYHTADRISVGERLMLPLTEKPGGDVTGLIGMTIRDWIDVPQAAAVPNSEHVIIPVSTIP